MEKLVILDYNDASVHFYDMKPDTEIDEEYLRDLGYKPNDCAWMFSEDMTIKFHTEILA